MNKAIATSNTSEENARRGIIKKTRGIPGKQVRSPQIEAHDVVANHSLEAVTPTGYATR